MSISRRDASFRHQAAEFEARSAASWNFSNRPITTGTSWLGLMALDEGYVPLWDMGPVFDASRFAPSVAGLLNQVATELHAFASCSRKDPWWFRARSLPSVDPGAYVSVTMWTGRAPSLTASIRMATYGVAENPVAMVECRAIATTGGEPARKATIRVSLDATAREPDSLGLQTLSKVSPELRRSWLKGARHLRARNRGSGYDRWWVDANTPEHVTALALLLWLINNRLVTVLPGTPEWELARDLVQKILKRRLEDGDLYQVLGHVFRPEKASGDKALRRVDEQGGDSLELQDRLSGLRGFALPSDWRGLPRYLRRVVATVTPRDRRRATKPLDEAIGADRHVLPQVDVPRRTYYRWLKETGAQGAGRRLDSQIRAKLEDRARTRELRRHAMNLLITRFGKTQDAARKFLQRRLATKSLDAVVGELNRGRLP
jgi:hypothetical protein